MDTLQTQPAPQTQPVPPGPDRPRRRPSWRAVATAAVTFGVPLLVFALHARRFGRWVIDDAAISYAYARSIAGGHGIVQQPGAPEVEGFSNPLWTALLVVLKWVGLFDSGASVAGWPDYVWVPRLLSAAGLLGTAGLLWWAFRPVLGGRAWVAAALAGVGLAVNPSYVIWVVSGLENPLYAVLVAALAAVLVRATATGRLISWRVAATTGLLALLCGLTRPDGVVFVGAYPLLLVALLTRGRLWGSVRSAGLSGLVFGVPMGAFLLWRHETFGLWVPNTAVAKAQQGVTFGAMNKVSLLIQYVSWPMALSAAAVVGLALGLDRLRPAAARLWPAVLGLLVCLLPALAAYGALNRDWMPQHRFATPAWVTGTALLAVCLVWVFSSGALAGRGMALFAAVVAASLVYAGALFRDHTDDFRSGPTAPLCTITDRYGRAFNSYADRLGITEAARRSGAQPTLALPDIGGTLLTTRMRVIDTAGLTDRTVAEARGRGDLPAIGDYLFDVVKPTFIHVHPPWNKGIEENPVLARDYVEIGDGDYVRREAVTDQQALAEVRANQFSRPTTHRLSSCGDELLPGSTLD
jgi:hypothetical protein